jgi:hypothetical protein
LALLDAAAAANAAKHGGCDQDGVSSEVSEFGGQPQAGIHGCCGRT